MATYFRLLDVGRQFFDSNGDPLNGGKLYTYDDGTTTNKSTYQDGAGNSAHANPIILDSAGRVTAEVWGTTGAYKLKLNDSLDSNIWTRDDIVGINDSASSAASEWVPSGLTPTYASGTTFTLAGDQTSTFHAGRRLKITDGSGTIYGTVRSVAFGASTTVTVLVDAGGTITNPTTAVQYGLLSSINTSSPSFVSGFYVTPSANQTGVVTATATLVEFATESYDYGNEFGTNTFNAGRAGIYLFTACVVMSTNLTVGLNGQIWLSKTGTAVAGSKITSGGTANAILNVSWMGPMAAADTMRVYFQHNLGSNVTISAGGSTGVTFFSGLRLA